MVKTDGSTTPLTCPAAIRLVPALEVPHEQKTDEIPLIISTTIRAIVGKKEDKRAWGLWSYEEKNGATVFGLATNSGS